MTNSAPKLTAEQVEYLDNATTIYHTRPSPVYQVADNVQIEKISTDNLASDGSRIYVFFADLSGKGEQLDLRMVDQTSDKNIIICTAINSEHLLKAFGVDELTQDILDKNLMRTKHLVMRSFYYNYAYSIPEKEVIY